MQEVVGRIKNACWDTHNGLSLAPCPQLFQWNVIVRYAEETPVEMEWEPRIVYERERSDPRLELLTDRRESTGGHEGCRGKQLIFPQENADGITVPKGRVSISSLGQRSPFEHDMRYAMTGQSRENIPEDRAIGVTSQFFSQIGGSEIREE